MKKLIAVVLGLLFCLAGLGAERLRIKVEGNSTHYNQIRIINKTDYAKFKCDLYILEEADGKTYVKESLGSCDLKGFNDDDTCTFVSNLYRGALVGVELPGDMTNINYSLDDDEGVFIDTLEIILGSGSDKNPVGKKSLGREF
ncbi:MAG: hypothetical protein IJS51_03955 [Treponema sp.]|nr:hypothetical protein [Treponema sp.]MBQ7619266.1 hypothetical protein [Treponema sp.]